MSYCRWSSMDFKCDLYCFEHVAGHYQTYVAGNKVVSPIFPDAPWKLLTKGGRIGMWLWGWWHRLHMFTVSHGIRRDITLPHAGASFEDETLEEFKGTLLMLRSTGYRFPDYVLQAVDEEIQDRDDNYDPTPYCSYHGSKKNCDCPPIAANE